MATGDGTKLGFEPGGGDSSGMSVKRESEVMEALDESAMNITMDELREFLEADLLDVRADPEFKERLRRKLWKIVLASSQRKMKIESDL